MAFNLGYIRVERIFISSLNRDPKTKDELIDKPAQALKIITFLNSKNKEELEELQVLDRTNTILIIRKVVTKKSLMKNLE